MFLPNSTARQAHTLHPQTAEVLMRPGKKAEHVERLATPNGVISFSTAGFASATARSTARLLRDVGGR